MGLNKLHIMTCMHRRRAEMRMFWKQFQYLQEKAGKEIGITIVCSTDSDYKFLTEELNVPEESVHKHVNSPLNRKHNLMLERAMACDWDGLIHLGSDDLISEEYLKKVERLDLSNPCFYALDQLYFNELKTGKIKLFSGKKIGAGRVFSRALVEKEMIASKVRFRRPYYAHMRGEEAYLPHALVQDIVSNRGAAELVEAGSKKYVLWFAKRENGLDNESNRVLKEAGYEAEALQFNKPQLIDVKGDGSLTSWHKIKTAALGHKFYQNEIHRISPVNFKEAKQDETEATAG